MAKKLFSLVIPAYREEKTIVKNLNNVLEVLDRSSYRYEIIVVDDGSKDRTYQKVKRIKNRKIKVLRYKNNQGKGYALRYGMLRAHGDVIGFMDAGMDLDPQGLLIALEYMSLHKADIIVGSKLHPDSEVTYPLYRRILSFFYRWMTQFLFGFNVLDTQVGLKIFKKKVVQDVFPRLLVKKFAFDIEVLALSNVLGYNKIYDTPVRLNFKKNSISGEKLLKIIFYFIWDTLAVFYRIRILQYYRKTNKKNWINIDANIDS